ncbi:MAG: hypothetical protein WC863_04735 [Patescibacteria group bacterium]
MSEQEEKRLKTVELLQIDWKTAMSINESSRTITTSLLSYFMTLNLATYGGIAWVAKSIESEWRWFLLVVLCITLFILNISIYQLYLRNYLYAKDCWEQIVNIKKYLSGNEEPEWRTGKNKALHKDSYRGITHKIFSFILSLFSAISFGLPFFFGFIKDPICSFDVKYLFLFVLVGVFFLALSINAVKEQPFIFGMKD